MMTPFVMGHGSHGNVDLCWRRFRSVRKLTLRGINFSTVSSFAILVNSFSNLKELALINVKIERSSTPYTVNSRSRHNPPHQLCSLNLQIDSQTASVLFPWIIFRQFASHAINLRLRLWPSQATSNQSDGSVRLLQTTNLLNHIGESCPRHESISISCLMSDTPLLLQTSIFCA